MEEEAENARKWINPCKEAIEMKTQGKVINIYGINNSRHFIFETNSGLKYYMKFQREFFNSFGAIFGKKGVGESVNRNLVEWALENGIHNFLFIHNGHIYLCPVKEFHDYAIANKTIRTTATGEVTMSVPVLMLEKYR
jgi:hypothetical protein